MLTLNSSLNFSAREPPKQLLPITLKCRIQLAKRSLIFPTPSEGSIRFWLVTCETTLSKYSNKTCNACMWWALQLWIRRIIASTIIMVAENIFGPWASLNTETLKCSLEVIHKFTSLLHSFFQWHVWCHLACLSTVATISKQPWN